METINNVAAAASKTIFGDASDKKEPLSGRTGDVSKGEPYDAGNLDPEDQQKFETLPTPGTAGPATPGFEKTADDTTLSNTGAGTTSTTTGAATGTTGESKDAKVTDDPTAAATTSTEPTPKGDTSGGQTDVTDQPANPADAKKEDKNPEENTVEPTGPGPKPVAVLAREHGGDAGQANKEPVHTEESTDKKEKDADEKKDEGTGEKVVHASGLAADGGDFDAAKPGAGVEADRLMGEKGIHPEGAPNKTSAASDSKPLGADKDKKDKPSLSERIKAKFHKKDSK